MRHFRRHLVVEVIYVIWTVMPFVCKQVRASRAMKKPGICQSYDLGPSETHRKLTGILKTAGEVLAPRLFWGLTSFSVSAACLIVSHRWQHANQVWFSTQSAWVLEVSESSGCMAAASVATSIPCPPAVPGTVSSPGLLAQDSEQTWCVSAEGQEVIQCRYIFCNKIHTPLLKEGGMWEFSSPTFH